MTTRKTLGTAGLLAAVLIACSGGGGDAGSSSSGGASGSGGALTLDAFAQQYCKLTLPCCTKRGLTSDPGACAVALTLGYVNNPFDPAAAQRCLNDLPGLSAAPTFCADGGGKGFEDACTQALAPTGTGTKAVGEPCERTSDCAPSPEGRTQCFGSEKRVCQLQLRAKEGEACVTTKAITDRYLSISADARTDQSRVGVCFLSDDLYCAGGSSGPHTCQKRLAPGADCRTVAKECAGGARCDNRTYTCTLPLEIGATCQPGTYSGSVGSDDPCVRSAYCDRGSKVCTANLAPGASCTSSSQCGTTTGSSCESGKCHAATNAFSCFE